MTIIRINPTACLSLALIATLGAACETTAPLIPAGPTISEPSSPSSGLPFNPLDPSATYAARLLIEDRSGGHPPASLVYDGTKYSTDASGVLSIPAVKLAGLAGVRLTAAGYMPRSVLLEYGRVSQPMGMRVVLEKAGVVTTFNSATPTRLVQGPMVIGFPADGFKSASGEAFNGTVTVSALGFDPVASAVEMTSTGLALRKDFDLDRVPQGYGVATDANGVVHFLLPESLFQVELSDDNGAPLQLNGTTPANYAFRLTGVTQHKEGDVVPTYSFDEKLQRWVEGGACTVRLASDGGLECAGVTTHFSSWMMSSGADSTHLACANLSFRYKLNPGEKVVSRSPGADACGVTTATELPATGTCRRPEVTSTSGACFYQSDSFSSYRAVIHTEITTATGTTERNYAVSWEGSASTSNLRLVSRGAVQAAELSQDALNADCGGCPATVLDVDLTTLTPLAVTGPPVSPPRTCGPCGGGATCSNGGACRCPNANETYSSMSSSCIVTSCMSPLVLNTTQNTCDQPPVDLCKNNGSCTTLQTCSVETPAAGGATAKCAWKTCAQVELTCAANAACAFDAVKGPACKCNAGFMGDGTSACVFTTDMASASADMTAPHDMAMPQDMTALPDMTSLPDFAFVPDFAGPPPAPDFGGPPPAPDFGAPPPMPDFGAPPPMPDFGVGGPDLGFGGPDLSGFGGPPDLSFGGPPDLSFGGPPDFGV